MTNTPELAQLFDCQQMPECLRCLVFDVLFRDSGNGAYHEFFTIDEDEEEDYEKRYLDARKVLLEWLYKNGYDPKYKCLINVWW